MQTFMPEAGSSRSLTEDAALNSHRHAFDRYFTLRQCRRLLCNAEQPSAARNFHDDHGQGTDPGIVNEHPDFFSVYLPRIIQLGAGDTECLTGKNKVVKSSQGKGGAICCQHEIRIFEMR